MLTYNIPLQKTERVVSPWSALKDGLDEAFWNIRIPSGIE